jgi:ABC-2 type transport system ATP-binding protein
MPAAAAADAASVWLKRLGLGGRQHDKLNTLSKGNQQKVQFISAILHKPKFVILDEPFTGLDPLNQELFIELIEELRDNGMTVLLSGHQMALIERLADRVLILHRGRELLSGTMRDIRRNVGAQQRLACRFEQEPSAHELGQLGAWQRGADGEIEWTLAGDGLSSALGHLATRMTPTSIRTEEPSLHSIYLQAIRGAEEYAQSN